MGKRRVNVMICRLYRVFLLVHCVCHVMKSTPTNTRRFAIQGCHRTPSLDHQPSHRVAFYLFINFLSTVASVGEISIVELRRTGRRYVLRPLKWRHSQALSSADNGLHFVEIEQNPHDDDNEAREHICWGLWRVTAAGGHTYKILWFICFVCHLRVRHGPLNQTIWIIFAAHWVSGSDVNTLAQSTHTHCVATRQYLFISFGHKTIENSLHSSETSKFVVVNFFYYFVVQIYFSGGNDILQMCEWANPNT